MRADIEHCIPLFEAGELKIFPGRLVRLGMGWEKERNVTKTDQSVVPRPAHVYNLSRPAPDGNDRIHVVIKGLDHMGR